MAIRDTQDDAFAAVILRALSIAVMVSAGAAAALSWMGTWGGMPNISVGAYLFFSLLSGAVTLWTLADRLSSVSSQGVPERHPQTPA